MLEWDQPDFIECLEVVPEEYENDYHGPFSIFRVENDGIQLELTVFPFEEDIMFKLMRIEGNEAIFEYQIMSCKSAKYEKLKDGSEILCFINKDDMRIFLSVRPDIRLKIEEHGY